MSKELSKLLTVIETVAVTAGGLRQIGIYGYKELKRPDSPLREWALNRISAAAKAADEGPLNNNLLYQIPGRWKTAVLTAEIAADPYGVWTGRDVNTRSLAADPNNNDPYHVFYMEIAAADREKLPGLYVVKELGDPIQSFPIPGTNDTIDVATTRCFLIGMSLVPNALLR